MLKTFALGEWEAAIPVHQSRQFPVTCLTSGGIFPQAFFPVKFRDTANAFQKCVHTLCLGGKKFPGFV